MIRESVFYEELGHRIQRKRKGINMTQEDLAYKVGLTRTSITNIEKGRQKVLSHLLVELADALATPIGDLLPKHDSTSRALESLPDEARKWIERSELESQERTA